MASNVWARLFMRPYKVQNMKKTLILALIFFNFSAFARENIFVVKKENGEIVDLSRNAGKKTVIIIFASWCKFCHQEMTRLKQLQEKNDAQNLEIIAVDFDEIDDEKDYLLFKQKFPFVFVKFSDILQNNVIAKPSSIPASYYFNENLNLVKEL